MIVFSDINEIGYLKFFPNGQTINQNVYEKNNPTFLDVFSAGEKRRYVEIHRDNASAHKAILTQIFTKENNIVLLKQPPYSKDLRFFSIP